MTLFHGPWHPLNARARFARRAAATTLALAFAWTLVGCTPPPPMPVGRAALLRAHNDNADRIPGVWAVADVEISFAPLGPLGAVRLTDGRLYYRRNELAPSGAPYFMLRGMEAGIEIFRLGCDPASGEFHCWMDAQGGDRHPWALVGRLEDIQRLEGDSLAAIDPVSLAAAMGVVPWPENPDLDRQAIVRVLDDPAVYEISLVARVDAWGGWSLLRREIIDRYDALLRPTEVHIHDRLGRDAMTMEILEYTAIETDADGGEPAPTMASDIVLYPPEATNIRWIRIRLSGATTGNDDQRVPPPGSFRTRIPSHITDIRRLGPAR